MNATRNLRHPPRSVVIIAATIIQNLLLLQKGKTFHFHAIVQWLPRTSLFNVEEIAVSFCMILLYSTQGRGEHLTTPGTFFVVGWSTEIWRHIRSENSLFLPRAGKLKLTATVSLSRWEKWPYFFIGDKFSSYFFVTMKWNRYSFLPCD